MATTIQVGEDTLVQLRQLRDLTNVESYNVVIQELLKKHLPKSLWGVLGSANKTTLKNLRDKHDRF